MASKKKSASKKKTAHRNRAAALDELSTSASSVVKQAAAILEEEIAAGIVAARHVENSLVNQTAFNHREFDAVLKRLSKDVHDIVTLIGSRVRESGARDTAQLAKRFESDAHDVVDMVTNLLSIAPELIGRFTAAPTSRATAKKTTRRKASTR